MRVFVAVLLLALVSVAAVTAQAPPANPLAPAVSIVIAEDEGRVSLDEAAEFTATVKNEGAPLPVGNEGTAADVSLSVSGVPAGWTVTTIPATLELQNGQSGDVVLRVSVSAEATLRTADLTVTAELFSPLEGLEGVLGQGGASQKATASDTLRVVRDDSLTRDVLERIGPWIYAILLLLVAAVLVAVGLSLSSRRSVVRLSSQTRELTVAPGARVTFPLQVEGLGKQEDAVLLQVSAVPEGWAAFLPAPELTLEPGQVRDISLIVIAPKTAQQGTRQAVLVTASSAKAPKAQANLEFVATVQGTLASPKRAKA